ncbi:hypothetical protein [Rhizobium sp. WYCCWR 11146]|uniref:hypothetical protein n=1 Tax=Rhizobium sp. WYCCWR 11146 TaxID=2749833 RepID=UPI0015E6524E|nr:hypothetical protein [Rhizobium sp. WYCCWR 11146]MBA1349813.1 hypothetical protein [Rhizobium sp. WYCCWR 11146]
MTDLNQALPNRKIRLRKTGVWPGVFFYLGGMMLLAVAGFIGAWQAPGVVNDWLVASDPVTVPDAVITEGECHARRVVFVDCSAHIAYEIDGKSVERDIDLMFVNFHTGDYEVDVVRSALQPDRAALSLGLDMLWNRTLVDSALVLGVAAGGIVLFAGGFKSDRSRRLARRETRLDLREVKVAQINPVLTGKYVQFQYGADRKGKPLLTLSHFGRKEEPYWLDGQRGMALAALPEGASVPVLLDAELKRLDASPPEIATIAARLKVMMAGA